MKTHPTLYKKSSTGADQYWTIGTEGNVIVTRWGQVGGKEQETRDVVKEGKNAGKKNATTAEQQAEAEAESQWEKKLKKGYVKDLNDARAGKVDEVIEGGVNPMLAHRFDEQGHKITYPAFAQPKFDGHRCIAVVKSDGTATLWSRTRKPITGLPHIIKALGKVGLAVGDIILDGELYNHDYKDRFEELTSFIRTPEPKVGHEAVQYHIYDVAGALDQYGRIQQVAFLASSVGLDKCLVPVKTVQVADEDELMLAFEGFLKDGYEGLMIRNAAGSYVGKRSYDLQKVKEFQDAEFTVVGVEEGRGKLAGHAIFVCTSGGTEFRVKMKGETTELKKYFENPKLAVGRRLTVKFQGFTNKGVVPRFPVGLRFREDV
jgi:DNA ligase-1